jgi:hypothetical protein
VRLPEGRRFSIHTHNGAMFRASYSATGRLVYTVGADRSLQTRSSSSRPARTNPLGFGRSITRRNWRDCSFRRTARDTPG